MSTRAVLLVEDDASQAELLRSLLEERGFTLLHAVNGLEALRILETSRPGLILLDLMMPVMSGYEFLRHLWADEKLSSLPVVVVSAADVRRSAGVVGFLRKPIDVHELLRVVELYCGPAEPPRTPVPLHVR